MTRNVSIACAVRRALALSAIATISAAGSSAFAQDQDTTQTVVVTGSRIQNQDYQSNSPLTTVSGEQVMKNQDVTLDTFLNTLPQVNPAGTTTSNNPGNNGQANIDLRGLGANRNLVLIDGRRAMPSASDLTVDLNTIPESMIENIEIITGGAGAVYGADAVAGVVNIKLKENFQGFNLSAGYSDSTEEWDSREYNVSATLGANFAEDRGNAHHRLRVLESRRPDQEPARLRGTGARRPRPSCRKVSYFPSRRRPRSQDGQSTATSRTSVRRAGSVAAGEQPHRVQPRRHAVLARCVQQPV